MHTIIFIVSLRLGTPEINYSGDVCVEFYTSMYGVDVDQLSIYTTERSASEPIQRYTDRSVSADMWTRREVTIRLNRSRQRVSLLKFEHNQAFVSDPSDSDSMGTRIRKALKLIKTHETN